MGVRQIFSSCIESDSGRVCGTCGHVESLIGYAGVNMALNLLIHQQPKSQKLITYFLFLAFKYEVTQFGGWVEMIR